MKRIDLSFTFHFLVSPYQANLCNLIKKSLVTNTLTNIVILRVHHLNQMTYNAQLGTGKSWYESVTERIHVVFIWYNHAAINIQIEYATVVPLPHASTPGFIIPVSRRFIQICKLMEERSQVEYPYKLLRISHTGINWFIYTPYSPEKALSQSNRHRSVFHFVLCVIFSVSESSHLIY